MALSFAISYTFSPSTTISSSQVNTNTADVANVFIGLEALTKSFAKLKVDVDPTTDLEVATKQYVDVYADYRRPRLTYVSATAIDVENNTGTANETKIVFPDGNSRSVTEDTSSTNKYRRFLITVTAEFLAGTEDSGLYTGLSEVANTWYAVYAVKSVIDSTKFVLVGTTTLPVQASVSTLNTNLGTSGWVYLGLIRNGDNSGATGDLLGFKQVGNKTVFSNACATTQTFPVNGTMLATGTTATLTYTYAAGTGAAQVPSYISLATINICLQNTSGATSVNDAGNSYYVWAGDGAPDMTLRIPDIIITDGVRLGSVSSRKKDIVLYGWIDPVLGVGSNPMI